MKLTIQINFPAPALTFFGFLRISVTVPAFEIFTHDPSGAEDFPVALTIWSLSALTVRLASEKVGLETLWMYYIGRSLFKTQTRFELVMENQK
jgi:hypothetical protein